MKHPMRNILGVILLAALLPVAAVALPGGLQDFAFWVGDEENAIHPGPVVAAAANPELSALSSRNLPGWEQRDDRSIPPDQVRLTSDTDDTSSSTSTANSSSESTANSSSESTISPSPTTTEAAARTTTTRPKSPTSTTSPPNTTTVTGQSGGNHLVITEDTWFNSPIVLGPGSTIQFSNGAQLICAAGCHADWTG